MRAVFTFREIEVIEEVQENLRFNVDFDGHYLMEFDENLEPTGNAMDGYGKPLQFDPLEVSVIVFESTESTESTKNVK